MTYRYFLKSIFTIALFAAIFSCNDLTGSDKKEKETDSLKTSDDTINLANYDRYFNDVARFYAGVKQLEGSTLQVTDTNAAWKRHHRDFTIFYDSIERTWFPPIVKFRNKELYEANQEIKTLYYPFSGPDFVHADLFFPNAENIIMIGLERVGDVPKLNDLSDARMDKFFKAVRISLDSIFTFGYFMTNDMSRDFTRSLEMRGVMPVIMIFLVRSGFNILDIQKVTINKQGKLIPSDPALDTDNSHDTYISGMHIQYIKPGDQAVRNLYYFSHDMSDQSLAATPEFLKFLETLDINVTFLKAASYLCRTFSVIRNTALSRSQFILQSDTGIPIEHFSNNEWDLHFYGKYTRTIKCFKWCLQPELKQIYQSNPNIKPLDFGIDYGCRFGESNLMIAKKKSGVNP